MRIYIPADSPEPTDLDISLADLLNGIRLTELETLDDLLDPETMEKLLAGEVTIPMIRPVLWVRLKRDNPDLELAGFDVELIEGEEATPGKD